MPDMHPVYALPDSAFITTADAAVLMRMSASSVRSRARKKCFPTYHRDGRPRYRKGEIIAYMEGAERVCDGGAWLETDAFREVQREMREQRRGSRRT